MSNTTQLHELISKPKVIRELAFGKWLNVGAQHTMIAGLELVMRLHSLAAPKVKHGSSIGKGGYRHRRG
jgi:hypothetical protein